GDGVISAMTGNISTSVQPEDCTRLEEEIRDGEGITGVRVRFNSRLFQEFFRFFVVIRSDIPNSGRIALARCEHVMSMDNLIKMRDKPEDILK
ncbi:MAG: hypothetical protein V1862_08060, partial [Methanobacteriota archaeon]